MCLTDCKKCKYLDRHPNHSDDILCSLQPAYASMWKRLQTLDEYSLNCLPVDGCSDFELDPSLEEKEITLALSYEHWQQINRGLIPTPIIERLEQQMIEITVSLPLQQWQNLARQSKSTDLVQQLEQQDLDLEVDALWTQVDSSCIDAIAFERSTSTLKIRFHSGSVYQYDDVSYDVFSDLLDAGSIGSFFNYHIKDIYSYTQL